MEIACACVLNLVLVPLTFMGGGINVVDAMDVIGEGGVDGASEDLSVGCDDCVCVGVNASMFKKENLADSACKCRICGKGVVDVSDPFPSRFVFLPCLWVDEDVVGCVFAVDGVS